MKRYQQLVLALLSGVSLLAGGCQEEDTTQMAPATARMLFVHAAPSVAQNVEVYTSDAVVYGSNNRKANLAFGGTAATNPTAGPRPIRLRLAEAGADALRAELALEEYGYYTALIANTDPNDASAAAPVGVALLQDDLAPPAGGNAKVRFVHLGVGAPAVDVYAFVNQPGAVTPATPAFANKSFGQLAPGTGTLDLAAGGFGAVTAAPFAEVPAGNYRLEVRLAGADPATPALLSAASPLAAGRTYTILARGALSPPAGSSGRSLGVQVIAHDLTMY